MPWTLKRAALGVPLQTMSAAQVNAPAWLSAIVRVPVKLLKASEPKSRSWSLASDTGLTTLTEVAAVIEAAAAGVAASAAATNAARTRVIRSIGSYLRKR